MDASKVERKIAELREARRAEVFARSVADRIEDELGDAGIELRHYNTHTAWQRVRPAEGKGESHGS